MLIIINNISFGTSIYSISTSSKNCYPLLFHGSAFRKLSAVIAKLSEDTGVPPHIVFYIAES